MKRKIIIFALIISIFIRIPAHALGYAVGDDVGDVLSTDIVAQINNCNIPSYNIDNSTAIKASDLKNYGFDVTWDEKRREVHIVRNEYKKLTPVTIEKSTDIKVGSKLGDVLHTDIKTYLDDKLVQAYNMNNSTLILFKDLNTFGTVSWDGQRRIAGLTLDETEVIFEDEIIDEKIRSIINKSEGNIYISDLSMIYALSFIREDIQSLDGLQYCKNLGFLQIDHCNIKDIDVLKELTNIENLRLSGNHIKDISALSALVNIYYLILNENDISDISALSSLRKLKTLDINNNAITDIRGLKTLTSLEILCLNNNKIHDLSTLSNLTNIKHLYLQDNEIEDISALKNLHGLLSLGLPDNKIESLDAISFAVNLQYLDICNNNIKDISMLKSLTNLETLLLDNNEIEDISILNNMAELKHLSIDDNPVKDLEVLDKLKKLIYFYGYKTNSVTKAKEILEAAKEIIAKAVKPGMSDYEKELAIHDTLLASVRYDYQNLLNNTIPQDSYWPYGLLVNKAGVCNAYAYSFKLLLDLVGIECIVVIGDTSAGLHAWNIVKIENEYYYVDPTWNDPPYEYSNKDVINYDYFNITGGQMAKDHEVNNELFPVCNGVRYNYKYLKYWSDNKIEPGSYSYLKGKIILPPDDLAAEGGTKIELNAYTGNNDGSSNDVCFTTVVTIPEGENSVEYSIPLIPNPIGYRLEYKVPNSNKSYYGCNYFDEKGTPVDLSRIMIDENDKSLDLQITEGWSIKGEISFLSSEAAGIDEAFIYIFAESVEGKKSYRANRPISIYANEANGATKGEYMINLEMNPQKVIIRLAVIDVRSNSQKDWYYAENGTVKNIKDATIINVSNESTNIDILISD